MGLLNHCLSCEVYYLCNMKTNLMKYFAFILLVFSVAFNLEDCFAQKTKIGDYIESKSLNDDKRGSLRVMNYFPDGNDFVCYNGKNRFTRALYGGYTDFRLETSDRPVFATYKKGNYRNVRLLLNGVPLDETEYCEARYSAGKRVYLLSDSRWKDGKLTVTALVSMDKELAILSFEPEGFTQRAEMEAVISEIKQTKLHRNGDMGVDKADCFEAGKELDRKKWTSDGLTLLSAEINDKTTEFKVNDIETVDLYNKALAYSEELASRVTFVTPDPYINTLGAALTTAADGDWDGETWLHGCIGWRMPLAGWRAAYVADVLGWTDRAKRHFDAYAASQVTDVPATIPHPSQDSTLNLARAVKKWGTQMYSNGYICKNPNRNNQMNHYDMNLNYIDELLWHFCYDADMEYIRKMWPVLKLHLEWEKRNFDPDDDGLYDAYCCIWASDALQYNSGAVTHSSAYNLRAFRMAARIAEMLGEDASWYRQEAEKTQKAINQRLWMKDKGVWAEFQDFMGHKRLHEDPALWTIYTAVDCGAGTFKQNNLAAKWVTENIPHIPLKWKMTESDHQLEGGDWAVVSTSDWMPYSWSINNVAPAEIMHMALAYFEAGRRSEGFQLLKSNILDQMYLGSSPGNFGQLSFYDAARGECYRDFGDVIGISSRALVQGLFGIIPDALNGKVYIRPGMPDDWESASVNTPYLSYTYSKENGQVRIWVEQTFKTPLQVVLLNGEEQIAGNKELSQEFTYTPAAENVSSSSALSRKVAPTDVSLYGTLCNDIISEKMQTVDLKKFYNSNIDDIFKNKYLSPRSPYTTLQIPVQGIGEWCHPQLTADINDSGFRNSLKGNTFNSSIGIPFKSTKKGCNIIYTSLFDNYPDTVTIPLKGKATHAYLLLAGSTNHMQSHIVNGKIVVTYTDSTTTELILENPYNWCPIEQDYFVDNQAFSTIQPRPYRVLLKDGSISRDFGKDLNITEVYGRELPSGAAEILDMKLDPEKEIQSLSILSLSNEVVIGLAAVTLQKP